MKKCLVSLCCAALIMVSTAAVHAAERLSFATGGTTGVYYPIGSAIASAISKSVEGVTVTAEATGANIANLKMLRAGDVDMMLSGAGVAYDAFVGNDMFADKPVTVQRGVMSLYPEIFQFVVLKSANINSIEDLKGKKVAVGAPGSGSEKTGRIILAAHGMTYEDDIKAQFLSFGEAITGIKDGLIDCAIVGAGIPTSAVMDISTMHEIALVPVADDKIAILLKEQPFLSTYIIPAKTYAPVSTDTKSVGNPALWIVHEDLSEETVYNMLKAVFANLDVIAGSHVQGRNLSLENALTAMSVPLHPGAAKFYKEHGIDVSEYLAK